MIFIQSNNWLTILVAFVIWFSLAGCLNAPAVEDDPLIIPPAPTAITQLATVASPPSAIQPSLVPTTTHFPTSTTTGKTHEATSSGEGTCEFDYFFKPVPASCPDAEPLLSAAAEQPFEGGVMIWLEATDSIYIFFNDQTWQRFDDTWSEEQPESDPNISPPDGRFEPIRGFGKVWRGQPEVRERLGWALGLELAFESALQEQMVDVEEAGVNFLLTFNGQVFALVNRGLDQGDWVIAAS